MKHPVPDEHLRHIGDITVSFALLEMAIQTLIGSLINEHQRIGQIITAELSFKNLRALVLSLYRERHGTDEDYEQLKSLMNEAGEIEDIRNQIIHSVWGAGKDRDHITRIKTTAKEKHGLKFQFQEMSANELSDFAKRIRDWASNIQNLYFKLIDNNKAINNPILKTW
jgi:hypothetical protein